MSYFNHYQRVNDLSEEGRRSHWRPFARTIGHFLPVDKNARIVDVGCGAGILLEWLSAQGFSNARGLDSDRGQIDYCLSMELHAEHTHDTAMSLAAFEDIDLVILKDVLEHVSVDEVDCLLSAARKALAPGGRVYVSVPNAAASFSGYWLYNDPTHFRSYTKSVLELQLLEAGFKIVHEGTDDNFAFSSAMGVARLVVRSVFRFFRRLEALGEFGSDGLRMPLGLNLVMVAEVDDS